MTRRPVSPRMQALAEWCAGIIAGALTICLLIMLAAFTYWVLRLVFG